MLKKLKAKNNEFSLTSNRNKELVKDFSLENELIYLINKFQKRKSKIWTYTYANNTKAKLDHILINNKWITSDLNCEAYSSFEGVASDHRIFTTKICRNTTQTTKTTHDDWFLLNNKDNRSKYTITVRNKFNALQEISETLTPNDEYENLVNAHIDAAAECIPTKLRAKHRVLWETLEVKKNEKI